MSAESLGLQRKRVAMEWATDNGDPLLANKKARQAAKDANLKVTLTLPLGPKCPNKRAAPRSTCHRTAVRVEIVDEDIEPSQILEHVDSSDDEVVRLEEMAEAELGRHKHLLKDWNSPIYVFFKLTPLIEVINGRHVHVFECNAKCCVGKGNGRMAAHDALEKVKSVDGSITAAFQRIAKDKITYSHCQLTTIEACAEFVRWVAEASDPSRL
ncbi:hypothetical protein EDB83DRAFT_2315876 [Lactarius deliciosus]|nr:hypothetical protein EDB83DRAFT_2315876 [Lactarius deliciosus]